MSSLTYPQIADLVRHRLGLPVDTRLRMQSLVRTALQRLGDKVAQDPAKRQYILSNRDTTTVTLSGGKVDLSAIIASDQLQLNYLTFGYIWHSSYRQPLQWKRGPDIGSVIGPFDNVFPSCWLEGTTLYTKGTNNQVLTGSLGLAVPYNPTVATLNANLEDDLLDECVGLSQAQPNDFLEIPGNAA